VGRLFGKLRIGEKIGLSFGLVGLLFLGVVWHYHDSLNRVLAGYERLHAVYEARKSHALDIEVELAETRQAENDFLIHREARFASAVDTNASALLQSADALAQVDQESRQTAQQIRLLTETYLGRFRDIAEAWQVKGLDHNSGLQGAFRDTVHELEDRAGNFKAGRLYLQLLQIRRGEKDLGLRREALYRDKVRGLVTEFRSLVRVSELYPEVQQALTAEIDVYARAFESYSEIVLSGGDLDGGKGPFRDSAHRLEALLEAHYVPDLETNILQLRRREKDYLLRNDREYVGMVQDIAETIRGQIAVSPIADPDKALLKGLLGEYERDFNALVAQNERIEELDAAMREAVENIMPLVKGNVNEADALAGEKRRQIAETSRESSRLNMLIAMCATLLGIFFAIAITSRIVRPVREMAGLLERLTHQTPKERIATVPGSRDEINAMAESVNTMADHRATFVNWWQASMDEAIALRDLHEAQDLSTRNEAAEELRLASLSKVQQLNGIRVQIQRHTARILEAAARMRKKAHGAADDQDALTVEQAAHGIQTLITVTEERT
jgi:HAMP domain-containing protein/CHASE3 domain sensor protein